MSGNVLETRGQKDYQRQGAEGGRVAGVPGDQAANDLVVKVGASDGLPASGQQAGERFLEQEDHRVAPLGVDVAKSVQHEEEVVQTVEEPLGAVEIGASPRDALQLALNAAARAGAQVEFRVPGIQNEDWMSRENPCHHLQSVPETEPSVEQTLLPPLPGLIYMLLVFGAKHADMNGPHAALLGLFGVTHAEIAAGHGESDRIGAFLRSEAEQQRGEEPQGSVVRRLLVQHVGQSGNRLHILGVVLENQGELPLSLRCRNPQYLWIALNSSRAVYACVYTLMNCLSLSSDLLRIDSDLLKLVSKQSSARLSSSMPKPPTGLLGSGLASPPEAHAPQCIPAE
ncbi:hypothetical protein OIY81_1180 [Cryptosporidium canis]|nr:hypothetical protein OIY81_1180 [Cryptosporidium canis]